MKIQALRQLSYLFESSSKFYKETGDNFLKIASTFPNESDQKQKHLESAKKNFEASNSCLASCLDYTQDMKYIIQEEEEEREEQQKKEGLKPKQKTSRYS